MTDAKTVLVTGASSGIGKGIALRFGHEGWCVALVARREAKLREVAAAISDAGGEPHVIVADLTQEDEPDRVVAAATEALGGIDVLVNNAGMGNFQSAEEISDAAYEAQFRLNVWSLTPSASESSMHPSPSESHGMDSSLLQLSVQDST